MLNNIFRLDFKLFPFVPFDMIRFFCVLYLLTYSQHSAYWLHVFGFRLISYRSFSTLKFHASSSLLFLTVSRKTLFLICSLSSVIGFKYRSHTSSEVTPESISVLYGTSFVYSDFSERTLFWSCSSQRPNA